MAPMAQRSSGRRGAGPAATVVDMGSGNPLALHRHCGGSGRRGGVERTLAELPVGLAQTLDRWDVGEGCGCSEPRVPCPGPSPILYSAGDGGPPAIWAGRPRSGRVQGVQPDLWIEPVEIKSNILPFDLSLFLFLICI